MIGMILMLGLPYVLEAQNKGSFTDTRDGQQYATVTYSLTFSGTEVSDMDEYGRYQGNGDATYQVMLTDSTPASLTWMVENLKFDMVDSKCPQEVEANCKDYGRLYTWDAANNACPQGWHLPSDDEWYLLANLYGGVSEAGQHLKSTDLGGTNKSFFNVKKPAIFWSSDVLDDTNAWDWKVNFRWVKLQRWKGGKNLYNSVRCVKNY